MGNAAREKPHRFRPSRERHVSKLPLPRLWPDSTIVLIASGPSVTKGQVNTVKDAWVDGRVEVITVNDSYKLAPWASGHYACDPEWWAVHVYGVRDTNIPYLWCQDETCCEQWGLWWTPGPDRNSRRGPSAGLYLGEGPQQLNYGNHSGFQTLNIAVRLGAKRILLLGYDLCWSPDGKKAHWFGDHPPSLNRKPSYANWATFYTQARPQLDELGIEVINCSSISAINAFPKKAIGACL